MSNIFWETMKEPQISLCELGFDLKLLTWNSRLYKHTLLNSQDLHFSEMCQIYFEKLREKPKCPYANYALIKSI
jgi:hypothetical protein